MLNFIEVKDDKLLNILNSLVSSIWNEYYTPMLGGLKVNYMLESIHNKDSIKKEIEGGCKYYILQKDDQNVGYLGFSIKSDNYDSETKSIYLNKLYLSKPFRNKGLGKRALNFMIGHEISKDAKKIWLMVNKNNIDTIKTYESYGFECCREEKFDIGKGYMVDECVMTKELKTDKIA